MFMTMKYIAHPIPETPQTAKWLHYKGRTDAKIRLQKIKTQPGWVSEGRTQERTISLVGK